MRMSTEESMSRSISEWFHQLNDGSLRTHISIYDAEMVNIEIENGYWIARFNIKHPYGDSVWEIYTESGKWYLRNQRKPKTMLTPYGEWGIIELKGDELKNLGSFCYFLNKII